MSQPIPPNEYAWALGLRANLGAKRLWEDEHGKTHVGWVVETSHECGDTYAYLVEARTYEEAKRRWEEHNKYLEEIES